MSGIHRRSGEPRRAAARLAAATKSAATTRDADKPSQNNSAVRNYMLFCFAGLLSMVPVMLMKGMDLWCIFPLVLGAASLMAQWRAGPVFVLVSLAVVFALRSMGFDPITSLEMLMTLTWPQAGMSFVPPTPVLDFLLSVCVIVYLTGHYRLQALIHHVVPPDARALLPTGRRVKGQPELEHVNPRRAPGLLTPWEIPLLGGAGVLSALAGEYAWRFFHGLRPRYGFSGHGWQTFTFIWSSALILFVAWSVFGYLARRRATPEESLLYLQDQLWRQTRREQSGISRWIAWARLRYQRWKEVTT
jgi:hypothetical protein